MMVEQFFGMFNKIVRKKKKFFFFNSSVFVLAIFAELDVDNATPLTSIVVMNTQK